MNKRNERTNPTENKQAAEAQITRPLRNRTPFRPSTAPCVTRTQQNRKSQYYSLKTDTHVSWLWSRGFYRIFKVPLFAFEHGPTSYCRQSHLCRIGCLLVLEGGMGLYDRGWNHEGYKRSNKAVAVPNALCRAVGNASEMGEKPWQSIIGTLHSISGSGRV